MIITDQEKNRKEYIRFLYSDECIIYLDSSKYTISKHIYGPLSEHLGRCIYDGLWVGKNSAIPVPMIF
jgi:hypothetical protein